MSRRFVFRVLVVALVIASAAATGGQTPPPAPSTGQPLPAAQAPFRSGIDLVLVDVTVLGRDGAPVATLDPADFTLQVDGRPRQIQSVRLVRTGEAAARPAVATTGGGAAAPLAEARRFVLVIDREHIPVGEGQPMLAAAAQFVDSLPPGDGVALWTSALTASTIAFSESRDSIKERIRLAVGTYRPSFGPWNIGRDEAIHADMNSGGGTFTVVDNNGLPSIFPLSLKPIIERECFRQPESCPEQVKAQVQEVARDARERASLALANLGSLLEALTPLDGPKHLVLVTGGPVVTSDNYATIASFGARAARARVTVHALQVRDPGYQARTDQMRAQPAEMDQSASAAYMLAGTTGGLALTPVTGEIGFSRLGRELSAGYVLAFETVAADRDGKEHRIDVQVRDQGWGASVRARKTFRADPNARVLAPPSLAIKLNPPPEPATPAPPPPQPAAAAPAPATPASPVPGLASMPASADRGVEQVVQRMAGYVAAYGPQTSVIVGIEKYTQQVTIEERHVRPRILVAEFAIVKAAGRVGWSGFRDVVEVDGKPVSDRRDRLMSLLTGPAGGESELRRISDESARYNVGPVIRNFNVPTTALFFFHPQLVDRFTFRRSGTKKIDGVETVALEFKETHRPTLVMKSDGTDVPCEGTVWVNPADGTIVRTRLRLRNFANMTFMTGGDRWASGGTAVAEFVSPPPGTQAPAAVQTPAPTQPSAPAQPSQAPQPSPAAPSGSSQTAPTAGTTELASAGAKAASDRDAVNSFDLSPAIVELESLVDIDVTYRPEANSGIWMPVKMTEVYEGPIPLGTHAPVRGRTVGQASYSNFKRFETSVKIVVPR